MEKRETVSVVSGSFSKLKEIKGILEEKSWGATYILSYSLQ